MTTSSCTTSVLGHMTTFDEDNGLFTSRPFMETPSNLNSFFKNIFILGKLSQKCRSLLGLFKVRPC